MEGTEVENVNKKINWQYAMMASAFLILALVPLFMSNNYYITILNQMVINMIVVFGLNFITGLAGQMNLGTAGIYALGAYTSALLSRNFGLSPWLHGSRPGCGVPDRQGTGISQPQDERGLSLPDDPCIF